MNSSTEYIVRDGVQRCVPQENSNNSAVICPGVIVQAYLEDSTQGVGELIGMTAALCLLWWVGWVGVGRYTVEDGYLEGKRCVVSAHAEGQRVLVSILVFCVEFPQLAAVSFTAAMEGSYSGGMVDLREILRYWLLDIPTAREEVFFPLLIVITLTTLALYGPIVLGVTSPTRYKSLTDNLTPTAIHSLEWLRDIYLNILPLPVFINLSYPFFCTHYEGPPRGLGEDSTVYGYTMPCWGSEHRSRMITSGVFLCIYYFSCIGTCIIPVMVRKSNDLQMHGRYTAISVQVRLWLAIMYCALGRSHKWWHSVSSLLALCVLGVTGLTMRPCLVERVNYHRAAIHTIAVWVSISNIYSGGMSDPTAQTPYRMLVFGTVLLTTLTLIRYFLIPETKVFPPMSCEKGTYEGGVSLGTLLRHGYGTQRWEDRAEYVGSWWLGKITGKGVLRLANMMYYEGQWVNGKRHGYGRTTIVGSDRTEYEGYFKHDEYDGFGKVTFRDGEVYEGEMVGGVEEGRGVWKFPDGTTLHAMWVKGKVTYPDDTHLVGEDTVEGPKRYGVLHGYGKRTYADGGVYEGMFSAGKRHGDGTMLYADDSEYNGAWENDMRHGDGAYDNPSGEFYEGAYKEDLPHGYGTQHTAAGEHYEGNFHEGSRSGYGKCNYTDSTQYVGSWKADAFSGKGSLLYPNEDQYEGPLLKGVREGNPGFYRFNNTDEYQGEFKDDDLNGTGVLVLKEVGVYTGTFINGSREGKGVFEWHDGSTYEGDWVDSKMNGEGVMSFRSDILGCHITSATKKVTLWGCSAPDDEEEFPPDPEEGNVPILEGVVGGKYEGGWVSGAMQGFGKMIFADGARYEGAWNANRPEGNGAKYYASGDIYKGSWVNGRRQGLGELRHPDGRTFKGQFHNDLRHGAGKLTHTSTTAATHGYWFNDTYVGPNITHFRAAQAAPNYHPLLPSIPPTECATVPQTLSGTEDMLQYSDSEAPESPPHE